MGQINDKPVVPDNERLFDARDVLAICMCLIPDARRLREIYAVLGFMTGAPVRTSEFALAMHECKSYLLHDHPEWDLLCSVSEPGIGADDWLEERALALGGAVAVRRH